MKSGTKTTTRLRKVSCADCGYTVRMARSWMGRGLPTCPCGAGMAPESPADLAFCGLIGPDDMNGPAWTAICRDNGWDTAINRKGAAAKAWFAKSQGRALAEPRGVAHCAFAGCGRWVAAGADRCTAGHAQHEHAPELEAMPF